ncbi:MAG: ABC transporter permease [Actinomycetota bacterium]|nr:ABC transporter permease [Actinomycetota bacterium]
MTLPGQASIPSAAARPVQAAPASVSPARAFLAILGRDLYVTGRELPYFVAQAIIQPLFLLFVFGRILTQLGFARAGYANLLFPGRVALTAVLTAIESTMLPLVIEFSYTKEIEDRLLAPLPTSMVALEKVLFSTLRALVAAAVMFPLGVWVLGSVPWHAAGAPLAIAVMILGAMVGSAIGLVLGTFSPPNRISAVFSLILTPLLFTGCSQYPWPSLDRLRWFQVVTAFNPLTYASEGMRAALVPHVPHIAAWLCLLVLSVSTVGLTALGMKGFRRRALE